ncbi:hypothetical protein MIR68_012006 [Amoeboaphelidium protococcarum]|nr:hypothetical protein MIR68_012006 [Amoeboaphelidium protococcarum]
MPKVKVSAQTKKLARQLALDLAVDQYRKSEAEAAQQSANMNNPNPASYSTDKSNAASKLIAAAAKTKSKKSALKKITQSKVASTKTGSSNSDSIQTTSTKTGTSKAASSKTKTANNKASSSRTDNTKVVPSKSKVGSQKTASGKTTAIGTKEAPQITPTSVAQQTLTN